jgi:uncharacterized protein YlxW (UPF0749 family)
MEATGISEGLRDGAPDESLGGTSPVQQRSKRRAPIGGWVWLVVFVLGLFGLLLSQVLQVNSSVERMVLQQSESTGKLNTDIRSLRQQVRELTAKVERLEAKSGR